MSLKIHKVLGGALWYSHVIYTFKCIKQKKINKMIRLFIFISAFLQILKDIYSFILKILFIKYVKKK